MNGWSWSLGRIFGIDTRVHATFLLLVGWSAFSAISEGGTLTAAVVSVLFLLAIFASVLLHEFGHALTARRYGITTRQIILSPLGGLAQLEGGMMPPRAEFWVALAGPAVSLGLAGALLGIAALMGNVGPSSFVGALGWANLMIAVFNMLPAFPMDGGRVFRAALSGRVGYRRATEIAAKVGRFAGVAMMIIGFFTRPLLALIGLFIYIAAGAEARSVRSFFGFGGGGPKPPRSGHKEEQRGNETDKPGWYRSWRERVRLNKLSAQQHRRSASRPRASARARAPRGATSGRAPRSATSRQAPRSAASRQAPHYRSPVQRPAGPQQPRYHVQRSRVVVIVQA